MERPQIDGSKLPLGQETTAKLKLGDGPERLAQSGSKSGKQLDKVTLRSIQDLFLLRKKRNTSDSSLTEHSDQLIKSINKLGLLRKNGKKEHKSDSIILDMQKQNARPEKVTKTEKKKQELKMILGRKKHKQTYLMNHLALAKFSKELPARQRTSPNPTQAKQTWTRPGSPNKQSSKLMKILNKSGRKNRVFTLGSSNFGSRHRLKNFNSTPSQSPNPKLFRLRNNSKKTGSVKQPNL